MRIGARFRHPQSHRHNQQGYILLTLILFMTLLAIAAMAAAPSIAFQVKRDREEELIHRGVQYSRAIQKYVKKFGRYPTKIEDLENTNQIRFLRKRYKDPITGKNFKLLHFGEVQLTFGAGIAGAVPAGAAGNLATASQVTNLAAAASTAQSTPGTASPLSGQAISEHQGSGDKLSGQVFGGGPIVGVVSTSKDKSIREFNHKDHYNQWQFIYDPSTDRGGLLSTPNQPPLQGAIPNAQPGAGVMGAPTSPGAPGAAPNPPGMQPQPLQPQPQPQQQPQPQMPQ
jgi:type II secretory pathway pseudopilin PulG